MTDLVKAVRLAILYGHRKAKIISATFIRAADPAIGAPAPTGTHGVWIEVRDPQGRENFRRTLPDPGTALEMAHPDHTLSRASDDAQRVAVLEVPWTGAGSEISIHMRAGSDLATTTTTVPLVPEQPPALRAGAAPLVVHPGWGAHNERSLTLLFLPDGFLATEMNLFHAALQGCIQLLGRTEPYTNLTSALRIAHADIPSAESGIVGDFPRNTAFGGHFAEGLSRLILVDADRALTTLNAYVSGGSAIAMIVANTNNYGGSGGAATVFSCERRSPEIALHELGHSAFGLADEYDAAGQSATDEPVEPNVCGFGDRGRLKWASLVPAKTPLPTLSAGEPAPVPPPTGIGAFEGAKYHQRGRFRPEYDCKMRKLGRPFCAVCLLSIQMVLSRHLPGS